MNSSIAVSSSQKPQSIIEPLYDCNTTFSGGSTPQSSAHNKSHRISHPDTSLKKTLRRFFFKSHLTSRAKRLSPHIIDALGTCSSVLDLGCGDMILTEFLGHNSGLSITALDTVDSNLSHLPLMLYNGDHIPFSDKIFEATMVSFVLHHCTDITSVLSEIKRVTSKKIIIMEEIYHDTMSEKVLHLHDFGNRFLSSKMHIPLNFLRIEQWYDQFNGLGLKLTNCTRIYQYRLFNLTHQVLFELSVC